ncbi:hypothetical protein FRB97_006174 [Tulasnella sp. 331]|nr:hypothetical protein FRB97_006174 [Tulasnella sp. 331]
MPLKRTPFQEVTNAAATALNHTHVPVPLEKLWSSPVIKRSKKRRRVDENGDNNPRVDHSKEPQIENTASSSTATVTPQPAAPRWTDASNFTALKLASTRVNRPRYHPVSTLPILQSLVSSHKHDVHGSRLGRESLFAVTTEEGRVEIINAAVKQEWALEPVRKSFPSHHGAVFDVRWSQDDKKLATASGDQQSCIMDVDTSAIVARFSKAHHSSVKQLQWDPYNPNLLASGGRDGSICFWDLRERKTKEDDLEDSDPDYKHTHTPTGIIHGAHGDKKEGRSTKFGQSTAPSITSILYGKQCDGRLYSSCSADGIIKLWDLRQSGQQSTDTELRASFESSPDFTTGSPSISSSSSRARGIVSLTLTPCGSVIYALSSGSQIHSYSALTLSIPESSCAPPMTLSDARLRVNSFYVRMAVSPCGNWLASGSSGGDVFLWEIGGSSWTTRGTAITKPVVLHFTENSGETTCVDWGADGMLVTGSDDGTIRTWRPDSARAAQFRDDFEGTRWNWAVATS